jgi:hypothetical protein
MDSYLPELDPRLLENGVVIAIVTAHPLRVEWWVNEVKHLSQRLVGFSYLMTDVGGEVTARIVCLNDVNEVSDVMYAISLVTADPNIRLRVMHAIKVEPEGFDLQKDRPEPIVHGSKPSLLERFERWIFGG